MVRAIPAAGGVVWRRRGSTVEIALVHRRRYDDWSLPKGKLHEDEATLAAAVREVSEEVGADVAVSRRLPDISYPTDAGHKTVSFWAMRCVGLHERQTDEVDEVVWRPVEQAGRQLTYDLERDVVAAFAADPVVDAVVVLVRHAKAGDRAEWRGDDDLRPLDLTGEQQALRLVPFLCAFAPDRIYSAEPLRCVQTVQPFADALGRRVQVTAAFSDKTFENAPDEPVQAVRALAEPDTVSVVCSQGDTIAHVVESLAAGAVSGQTRKAGSWVLNLVHGTGGLRLVAADYYDQPI